MDQPQFNYRNDGLSAGSGLSIGLLAGYLWTAWNPSDVVGTVTNAPATGTADNSTWVTAVNSSGTVTLTFAKAGRYLVSITGSMQHANAYTFDRLTLNLGGTATRRNNISGPATNSGIPNTDSAFTQQIVVIATAGQTLTVLPSIEVSGSGTTAQHTANANLSALYAGG